LYQNAPNPFNPRTTIPYRIGEPGPVSLGIYDCTGRLIKSVVVEEYHDVGRYEVIWDGTDALGRSVASGIYIGRLESRAEATSRRLTLLR
jgi:hypothetical protein